MNATNPYELFSPIHLTWLYRCQKMRLDITAADLDSIEKHQPDAVEDMLFNEYRALADERKVYRRTQWSRSA